MVNLDRALVVGFCYRHSLMASAMDWVEKHFTKERQFLESWDELDIVCARNAAIDDYVLPAAAKDKTLEWAILIDNDVTISHPGIENFLRLDGDLIACECKCRNSGAWESLSAFHLNLAAVRIEVFRRVSPPWFLIEYDEKAKRIVTCECRHFARRAVAAGFKVVHGGYCGHNPEGKWHCPS